MREIERTDFRARFSLKPAADAGGVRRDGIASYAAIHWRVCPSDFDVAPSGATPSGLVKGRHSKMTAKRLQARHKI